MICNIKYVLIESCIGRLLPYSSFFVSVMNLYKVKYIWGLCLVILPMDEGYKI